MLGSSSRTFSSLLIAPYMEGRPFTPRNHPPTHGEGGGIIPSSLTKADPDRVGQTLCGQTQERKDGREREMQSLERSEVRGLGSEVPPRVLLIPPYENHSIEGEGDLGCRRGGDLPTCPHPACLGLWVPAIFGQKILPQLRDA